VIAEPNLAAFGRQDRAFRQCVWVNGHRIDAVVIDDFVTFTEVQSHGIIGERVNAIKMDSYRAVNR